jgi:uncharacterized lipoprotein
MMKTMLAALITIMIVSMSGITLHAQDTHAQDIAGDWQGTIKVDASASLRIVLHITKSDNGGWSAMFYSIDQGPDGIPVSSVTLQETSSTAAMQESSARTAIPSRALGHKASRCRSIFSARPKRRCGSATHHLTPSLS